MESQGHPVAEVRPGSEVLEEVLLETAKCATQLQEKLLQYDGSDPEGHVRLVSRLVELMGKTKEVNEKAEFTRKEVPAELLKHVDNNNSPALFDAEIIKKGLELNSRVTGKSRAIQALREALTRDLESVGYESTKTVADANGSIAEK